MEERTKKGLKIGGGAVLAVGVGAAVWHWWPSSSGEAAQPGQPGKRGRWHGHRPEGAPGAASTAGPPASPSPQLEHVSPSSAAFVPGAPRRVPLVRRSHWHAFPPGAEVVTRLRSGHYAQFWLVGPDGVTLTAVAEPVRMTPELFTRTVFDLHRAHPIGPYARQVGGAHHDPHHGAIDDRGGNVALEGALGDPPLAGSGDLAKALQGLSSAASGAGGSGAAGAIGSGVQALSGALAGAFG